MLIVVPCDFTPVVDAAISYVKSLEKFHPVLDVHLLHVVEKEQEIPEARERLEQEATRLRGLCAANIKPVISEGGISGEIPGYAEEVHADLVIMGIHETKGLNKLFASKVIRVIVDSNIPFLAVQKPPVHENPFARILMPMGALGVEKGKFEWAVRNAKLYGAHIFVLPEPYNDSSLINKRDLNIQAMSKVFDANHIFYTLVPTDNSSNFKQSLYDFAKEKEIDVFLIMITQALKPMVNSTDQQILANPLGLPVLSINPAMIL